ncbi:MFS transporter [Prauserella shujinwangii]|uniref:MFS transporter n=1 Tax=Prauserella shujinwangii TaxID=1453103 RepID=UPI000D063BB9|nr:MFS transporter [Prauserella shujinwangii]
MTRGWGGLLLALGADNLGTGLFLPLVLVYVTRVVGLPLALAGTVVTAGTVGGLLVPPLAGRLVDRAGPRVVVLAALLVQAAGVLAYLVAGGVPLVAVAALLFAAGQQLFYCALFALIADVSGARPNDHAFAVVNQVRAAAFGVGALLAGGLLAGSGTSGMRLALILDGLSFLLAAVVLVLTVPAPHARSPGPPPPAGVLRNRPYLALIVISGLFGLPLDFFLVGLPVFVINRLEAPMWLPGAVLALLTAVTSGGATLALRATEGLRRTTAMTIGSGLYTGWALAGLATIAVPAPWRPAYLLLVTLVLAAANLVFGPRASALAVAEAPPLARGRYLAAYQYAFTTAQVVAPAVVALFSVTIWLPWALVALSSLLSMVALRWLARRVDT